MGEAIEEALGLKIVDRGTWYWVPRSSRLERFGRATVMSATVGVLTRSVQPSAQHFLGARLIGGHTERLPSA